MKKFLVILMVVAMSSFLFVGCLPGVTPVEPVEPVTPTGPTSTTPAIFDIQNSDDDTIVDVTATGTEYINKADVAGNYIKVTGLATGKALVKVYIGSATTPVAVGTAEDTGIFTVAVAKSALGVEGAKTLYATATEVALAESAKSNVVAFTLDTVVPKIETISIDDKEVSDIVLVADLTAAAEEVTIEMSEPVKSGSAEAEIYCIEGPTFVAVDAVLYGAFTISKDKLTLTVTPELPSDWIEGIWTYGVKKDVLEDLAGNPFDGSKTFAILLYVAEEV